jgi:hypothetical protein
MKTVTQSPFGMTKRAGMNVPIYYVLWAGVFTA